MPSGRLPGRQRFCVAAVALAAAAMPFGGAAQVRPVAPASTPASAPALVHPLIPRIVARYPHDPKAFTQGLLWHDGHLYESLGREGQSEVRRVRLEDGGVLARARLPANQFGEGLAAWRGSLISLTWKHGLAYRWNPRTLKQTGTARYSGEGWGLASDGESLILSDGTPTLRFLDPESFAVQRTLTITANGRPLHNVNELEVVDGMLFGNVWHRNYLVRIDPASGAVTGLADLSALATEMRVTDPEGVLNGVAWDPDRRRLFVTGKLWPTLFEIALEEKR